MKLHSTYKKHQIYRNEVKQFGDKKYEVRYNGEFITTAATIGVAKAWIENNIIDMEE